MKEKYKSVLISGILALNCGSCGFLSSVVVPADNEAKKTD